MTVEVDVLDSTVVLDENDSIESPSIFFLTSDRVVSVLAGGRDRRVAESTISHEDFLDVFDDFTSFTALGNVVLLATFGSARMNGLEDRLGVGVCVARSISSKTASFDLYG